MSTNEIFQKILFKRIFFRHTPNYKRMKRNQRTSKKPLHRRYRTQLSVRSFIPKVSILCRLMSAGQSHHTGYTHMQNSLSIQQNLRIFVTSIIHPDFLSRRRFIKSCYYDKTNFRIRNREIYLCS